MGLKVIGAGFGRTGTLSLKLALERLGFDKCYHMMEMPKCRTTSSNGGPLPRVRVWIGKRSCRLSGGSGLAIL